MSEASLTMSRTVAAWLQVVALLIGIGAVVMAVGRRDQLLENHDQQITELKSVASDLVRAQLTSAGNFQLTTQRITELERRMNLLK